LSARQAAEWDLGLIRWRRGPHFLHTDRVGREPFAGIRFAPHGISRNGSAQTIPNAPAPKVSEPSDVDWSGLYLRIQLIPMKIVVSSMYLDRSA
jgi:hypothetical protein